jgi:uncharacterized membrane protein
MNQIFGLPAHPLMVHIPIVLIPLLAVMAIGYVARPAWRPGLSAPLAILATITAVGTLLAANTGESLRDHVNRTELVRAHIQQGDQLKAIGVLFGMAVFGLVVVENAERRRWQWLKLPALRQLVMLAAVVTLLMSAVAVVWDVRAGHSGAKAVWSEPGRLNTNVSQSAEPRPTATP